MRYIISSKNKKLIRELFEGMQSMDDLVSLLNRVHSILFYKNKTDKWTVRMIKYWANPNYSKNRYRTFTIPKKSGGEQRIIHSPNRELKEILKVLNLIFQTLWSPHPNTTGFIPRKSIVTNAQPHTGFNYVFNLDLKDFFHSFDRQDVKYGLMRSPFHLDGVREKLAFYIASLCTHPIEIDGQKKIVLPQGSPTSPILTNILSYKLDRRMTGLAKRFGLRYTRYADDITFSSMHNVYSNPEFLNELQRIIEEQGFRINTKKTRLQKRGYRQEVTGVVVNTKPNVHRRFVKKIRLWLYLWERYGYEKAQEIFLKDYLKDKGYIKRNAHLINVLRGQLEYMKMVKGEKDYTYRALKKRYDKVFSRTFGHLNSVDKLLKQWEKVGLDGINVNKLIEKSSKMIPLGIPYIYTMTPTHTYKWKITDQLYGYLVTQPWGLLSNGKIVKTTHRFGIILGPDLTIEETNERLKQNFLKGHKSLIIKLAYRPILNEKYESWLKRKDPKKLEALLNKLAENQLYKKSNGELILINNKVVYRTVLYGENDLLEPDPEQKEFLTSHIRKLKSKNKISLLATFDNVREADFEYNEILDPGIVKTGTIGKFVINWNYLRNPYNILVYRDKDFKLHKTEVQNLLFRLFGNNWLDLVNSEEGRNRILKNKEFVYKFMPISMQVLKDGREITIRENIPNLYWWYDSYTDKDISKPGLRKTEFIRKLLAKKGEVSFVVNDIKIDVHNLPESDADTHQYKTLTEQLTKEEYENLLENGRIELSIVKAKRKESAFYLPFELYLKNESGKQNDSSHIQPEKDEEGNLMNPVKRPDEDDTEFLDRIILGMTYEEYQEYKNKQKKESEELPEDNTMTPEELGIEGPLEEPSDKQSDAAELDDKENSDDDFDPENLLFSLKEEPESEEEKAAFEQFKVFLKSISAMYPGISMPEALINLANMFENKKIRGIILKTLMRHLNKFTQAYNEVFQTETTDMDVLTAAAALSQLLKAHQKATEETKPPRVKPETLRTADGEKYKVIYIRTQEQVLEFDSRQAHSSPKLAYNGADNKKAGSQDHTLFDIGTKGKIVINWDYLYNKNNILKYWDKNGVLHRETVGEVMTRLFGKDWEKLLATEEGRKVMLDNEEFVLMYMPTSSVVEKDGKQIKTHDGINDYYWWNDKNAHADIVPAGRQNTRAIRMHLAKHGEAAFEVREVKIAALDLANKTPFQQAGVEPVHYASLNEQLTDEEIAEMKAKGQVAMRALTGPKKHPTFYARAGEETSVDIKDESGKETEVLASQTIMLKDNEELWKNYPEGDISGASGVVLFVTKINGKTRTFFSLFANMSDDHQEYWKEQRALADEFYEVMKQAIEDPDHELHDTAVNILKLFVFGTTEKNFRKNARLMPHVERLKEALSLYPNFDEKFKKFRVAIDLRENKKLIRIPDISKFKGVNEIFNAAKEGKFRFFDNQDDFYIHYVPITANVHRFETHDGKVFYSPLEQRNVILDFKALDKPEQTNKEEAPVEVKKIRMHHKLDYSVDLRLRNDKVLLKNYSGNKHEIVGVIVFLDMEKGDDIGYFLPFANLTDEKQTYWENQRKLVNDFQKIVSEAIENPNHRYYNEVTKFMQQWHKLFGQSGERFSFESGNTKDLLNKLNEVLDVYPSWDERYKKFLVKVIDNEKIIGIPVPNFTKMKTVNEIFEVIRKDEIKFYKNAIDFYVSYLPLIFNVHKYKTFDGKVFYSPVLTRSIILDIYES